MGKVDELQDAVDHGVAERDQGVHEAQNDAIEEDLRQDFESEFQIDADPSKAVMLTNSPFTRHCRGPYDAEIPPNIALSGPKTVCRGNSIFGRAQEIRPMLRSTIPLESN